MHNLKATLYHYQPNYNGNVFSTTFYSESHTYFLLFSVSFIFQCSKLKLPAAEHKVVKHLLISCLLILRYTVCRQPDSIDINHIIYIRVLCMCSPDVSVIYVCSNKVKSDARLLFEATIF